MFKVNVLGPFYGSWCSTTTATSVRTYILFMEAILFGQNYVHTYMAAREMIPGGDEIPGGATIVGPGTYTYVRKEETGISLEYKWILRIPQLPQWVG